MRWFSTITVLLLCLTVQAQIINPPNLVCATRQFNGDVTLTWQLPSNPCGSFNSYDIYHSNSFNGPYSLLASINVQATTTFVHVGADCNNQQNFYYMQSDYNCPGGTVVTSDTLDCEDPAAPELQYVTVNGNNVEVYWDLTPDPDVYAYIVYRFDGGFNPIDTVYGKFNTFYNDETADPNNQTEQYVVAAMDSCGNTGPFSTLPHQTILLTPTAASCNPEIRLDWTGYLNWPNDSILEHRIYYSVNGSVYQIDTVLGDQRRAYTFTNFNDGDYLCIYVAAVHPDGTWESASNQYCVNVSIVQPAFDMYMRNATVLPDSTILIEWRPDQQADLQSIELDRSNDASSWSNLSTQPVLGPLPAVMSYNDMDPNSIQNSKYYRVTSFDSCDSEFNTDPVRTMFLKGKGRPNFTNFLEWNPFEIAYGTVDRYRVFRLDNGTWGQIATAPASSDPEYEDNIANLFEETGQFCYYVEADFTLNLPTGLTESVTSASNRICVTQLPIIHVPTAIIPQGDNNEFRPVISFEEPGSYRMTIYNRWGQQIFETMDITEAWDGRYNGEIVQQGVYTYLITLTAVNGNLIERKGTVMVIR